MIYAVASGPRPGIYFSWQGGGGRGAQGALRGQARPDFQSCSSVADAERYLSRHGLVPHSINDVGWISTASSRTASIRYTHRRPQPAPSMTTKPSSSTTTTTPSSVRTIPTLLPMASRKSNGTCSNSNSYNNSSSHDCNHDDDQSSLPTSTHSNKYPASAPQSPSHSHPPRKKKRIAETIATMAATTPPTTTATATTTTIMKKKETIQLDACQQRAVDAARDQRNVFLTGVAGTGKSFVTKLIYDEAKERYRWGSGSSTTSSTSSNINKKVALCAPTGMAAVGLGGGLNGQTIHSLAGVKVPLRASDFATMRRSPANEKKWRALECLIIDEVGMLSADFLDWLDWNVRQIRHRPLEAFGGIQLIFVGDFAQLGPVPGSLSLLTKSSSSSSSTKSRSPGPPYPPQHTGADCFLNIQETTAFAFQSALWREADFCHVHLTEVYRQTDRDFVQSLMDLRQQRPHTASVRDLVQKCATPLDDVETRQQIFGQALAYSKIPEGLLPTVLYTNNKNADRENAERLASLNSEQKRFVAEDTVQVDKVSIPLHAQSDVENNLRKNKFFDQCHAPKHLDLKIGAQVMLLQNISTEEELVNGSRGVVEKFVLVPVVRDFLGTEERLIGPDDQDLFPEGKTFEQLDFKTVFHFLDKTWKMCRKVKYPLVRFVNNKTRTILPTTFERTLFGQGSCRRKQLPLRLSWALTIHKAQGCTLDWLICDLEGCFTAGQAYVALSRARSMAGLQIRNFSPNTVLTNPLVDAFYQALATDTVSKFLQDQAGLWWYPIYFLHDRHPTEKASWYRMFTEACSTAQAKANAQQFCHWVATYRPSDTYQGWKGYQEPRKTKISTIRSPIPNIKTSSVGQFPSRTSTQQQHRTVTPVGASQSSRVVDPEGNRTC